MECEHDIPSSSKAFFEALIDRAKKARLPVSASFEITSRCNLRCLHCYLDAPNSQVHPALNTQDACLIIDKIANAGCLFLLFTGGEPMLRSDFKVLYRHAKERGLAVRVFSNGTRMDEPTVHLFKEYPPLEVEISLYGSTPEMYERVTGSRDGFSQCMDGIRRLLDNHVRVKLKTVLMRQNLDGLPEMKAIANQLMVPFRFDSIILSKLNGNGDHLHCRITPRAVVEAERLFGKPPFVSQNSEAKVPFLSRAEHDLFVCGAARTSFAVDPAGIMSPCLLIRGIQYDLLHGTFEEGWNQMASLCRIKSSHTFPCVHCPDMAHCSACSPMFQMETGNVEMPPRWICEIAQQRRKLKS